MRGLGSHLLEMLAKMAPEAGRLEQRYGRAPLAYMREGPKARSYTLPMKHGENVGLIITKPEHEVIWEGEANFPPGVSYHNMRQRRADMTRANARYGREAMRGVMAALEADAQAFKPKSYRFTGMTDTHDKLYQSLAPLAQEAGYRMRPTTWRADRSIRNRFGIKDVEGYALDRFRTPPVERTMRNVGALGAIGALLAEKEQ